jgi:hypothetical protein
MAKNSRTWPTRWLCVRLIGIVAVFVTTVVPLFACPGGSSVSRWRWYTLEVVNNSAYTVGVPAALGDWNSAQNTFEFTPSTTWADVTISDDSSISPDLGLTTTYSQAYNHECLGFMSQQHQFCVDSTMTFYVDVRIRAWDDTVAESITSHELGHVLHLANDTGSQDCVHPTIMNVADFLYCPLSGPQTCDINQFYTEYSGWGLYTDRYCDTSTTCFEMEDNRARTCNWN